MKGFKFGWLSGFGMMVGVVGLGVCALSALAIVMEWEIELAGTALPDDWSSLLGLLAACGLICILSLYGAFMRGKFQAAKGKPMVRVAILVIGLGLLVLAFRGIQIVALTGTYGSMLAYYATDGDLEDVAAELAKNPKPEDMRRAMSRAAQYNNTAAFKLLIAAGAAKEKPYCGVSDTDLDLEFIKLALASGATAKACPDSPDAISRLVRFGDDDAKVAERVTLLRAAGWDPRGVPADDDQAKLAIDYAKHKKWPKTIAALQ